MKRVSPLVTIKVLLLVVGSITALLAARTDVVAQDALELWKQAQQFRKRVTVSRH